MTTQDIRNLAIAGHGGTGKTTFVEQLLYNGGVISRAETVESGKTVSDYTDEEISRKTSIHATLSHIMWKNRKINLIDAPGAADFAGEVVSAFRSAETAVLVVGAKAGVQIETIKLWRRLNNRHMPRMIFVNRMDEEHADFQKILTDLGEKFNATFVPITVPIGAGKDYKGIIDLVDMKTYLIPEAGAKEVPVAIPAEFQEVVDTYHTMMVENAAEGRDDLIEKYFAEGNLSELEIEEGLSEGMRTNKIVPVFCGSATMSSGIIPFLDFMVETAPSPAGIEEVIVSKDGTESKIPILQDGITACFVFKTSLDQFNGKLSFIKVMHGTLKSDTELLNDREGKKEKIGRVYTCLGKKLEEVPELIAGDIGIVTKLQTVHTNDTLSAADAPVHYKRLMLPQPVHSITISAGSKKDDDKLDQMLHKVCEEDLTFTLAYNPETHETVVSGMGELHINMILDKIKDTTKIDIHTNIPRIAYRETITKEASAEYTHKKQTGGHGQYAKVVLAVRPIARGANFSFKNEVFGGAISKGFIPGIEKGIIEGMINGVLAEYQVVDIEASVLDGKEHPVDSSEMAFKLAARGALKEAMLKAGPILLEPVMNLSVFVEDQYLGDVLSDLSSRRGKVLGQEPIGSGILEIKAQVPQAELLRYSIDLRSITSGTASFEMGFDHYSPISGKNADEVIRLAKEFHEAEKAH